MQGGYRDQYDSLYILDCRFGYEFNGGHIQGAHHIVYEDQMKELLFSPIITSRTLIILHCEFSEQRGPAMYFICIFLFDIYSLGPVYYEAMIENK